MDVGAVLLDAWHEIRIKWPYLLFALLPVATIAVVLGEFFGEQGPFEPFAPAPVIGLLLSATLALFALICHRIVLLGPDQLQRWSELLPWRQYAVFLLITLALDGLLVAALFSHAQLLLLVPGLFVFESVPWSPFVLFVSFLVIVVAVVYALTRASLSLPAAAIGRLASPKAIWRWSRGNGWRLTAAVVASVLLACVFWGVLFLAVALMSFPRTTRLCDCWPEWPATFQRRTWSRC